jgi:class 3 adenylate cyclase
MADRPAGPQDERDASLTRGFLFADLRGYTDYAELHGNRSAADLLERYRTVVRAAVAASRGAEIRTEGDSFYVVFPSASGAVRCGLAIIEAAHEASRDHPDAPIQVGVGVHAGETVETANGLVGSAVNIAARICAQAKAGEVVVSETVRSLTRTSLDVRFQALGARRLKGVEESIPLFRVVETGVEGRRSSRRGSTLPRTVWLGIGAILTLAVVAAVLVVGSTWLRASALSTPSPSAGSPPASSNAVASPSASSSAGALTADEGALLARIPLAFQPYCRRSSVPDGSAGGVASLRCDLPLDSSGYGADAVWYDSFASRGLMVLAFNAITGREGLVPVDSGDCAAHAIKANGRWSLGTTFIGQLACYPKGNEAWLLWSYEGDQVLARAVRRNGDAVALRTWWRDQAAAYLR